jgi:hypothetical protein
VDIQRQVEVGAGAQDRLELLLVEVVALRVAVDLDAVEAELLLAAAQLFSRPSWILRRDRDHAVEPVGIALAGGLQLIVRVARDALGVLDVEQRLHAWAGERQHRLVDAALVHRLDAQLSDVEQPLADEGRAFRRAGAVEAPQAGRALVGAAFLDQPHDRIELLLGGPGLLGGDAQVPRSPPVLSSCVIVILRERP